MCAGGMASPLPSRQLSAVSDGPGRSGQGCTLQREQGFREWNVTARSGPPPSTKLCQLSSSQAGTLPSMTMLGRKRFMSMGCGTFLFRSSRDDCMHAKL